MAPKAMKINESITINAPAAVIFDQLKSLKNQDAWSPWKELDPQAKITFEGTDGTVGSKTSWEGNDKMGVGSQTITKIDEGKRVESSLDFEKPYKDHADVFLTMEPDGQGQKVNWGFESKMSFPGNIFAWLGGAEKSVSKDFKRGLEMLKVHTEKIGTQALSTPSASYEIKENPGAERIYAGVRSTVKFSDISAFFAKNFQTAFAGLKKSDAEMTGAPSGLFFSYDREKRQTDMAAAVPINKAPIKDIKPAEIFKVKASKWLSLDYYGAYDKSESAHNAMDAYIQSHHLKQLSPIIEEYITDPMAEKDTAKWLTKIYYPVE